MLPSQYDLALQDVANGELYFDALKDIDSDLDKYGSYVNVRDFTTFSDSVPLSVSWDPDQDPIHDHGEHISRHVSGANVCIFVSELKDDGSFSHDHSFWVNYFHHKNVSHHIYQGILHYAAQVAIIIMKVHDMLESNAPRITTPRRIDHETMLLFFAWMPFERVHKTFDYTIQFMRIPSSTYLR